MKTSILSTALALCLLVATASAAEVSTDKGDYAPGDVVLISGSGFAENAPLAVTITVPDGEDDVLYAETDDTGAITNLEYDLDGVCGTYTLTATDGANEASTTFTDATCIWTQSCTSSATCTGAASGSKWYYSGSCYSCKIGMVKHCKYSNNACADQDDTDGVPEIGGVVRVSGAECDQNSDCSDDNCPQDECKDAPSCEERCDGDCLCLFFCYMFGQGDEDMLWDDFYDYSSECNKDCGCGCDVAVTIDDERCEPPEAPEFPIVATAPLLAGIGLLCAYGVNKRKS
ncbi:MAG: hypothetical protein JXC85_04810 [Candidatus Aenigmarchaeota archaeon]|nr:hypothetical protein [Candidatus Aenigmarchaeota archaeon]